MFIYIQFLREAISIVGSLYQSGGYISSIVAYAYSNEIRFGAVSLNIFPVQILCRFANTFLVFKEDTEHFIPCKNDLKKTTSWVLRVLCV